MCSNYDLCESCIVQLEGEISRAEPNIIHDASHVFYRVPSSSSTWGRKQSVGFGSGSTISISSYPTIVNRSAARHIGVTCTACHKQDPEGYLYQCQQCAISPDSDTFLFCEACEAKGCHAPDHPRIKIAVPKRRVEAALSAALAESRAEVSRLKAQLDEVKLEKEKTIYENMFQETLEKMKGETTKTPPSFSFGMMHFTSGRDGEFSIVKK